MVSCRYTNVQINLKTLTGATHLTAGADEVSNLTLVGIVIKYSKVCELACTMRSDQIQAVISALAA